MEDPTCDEGQGPEALRTAIREDHERTDARLAKFRAAWLSSDGETVLRDFRRFRRDLVRHLVWEERAMITGFRDRALSVAEVEAVTDDCGAHRSLREISKRIANLLPERQRNDRELDRRILELVDSLEELLRSHRVEVEARLCEAFQGMVTPAACDVAVRSMRRGPAQPD